MKLRTTGWLIVVSFAFLRSASGQGFVNLDFEQSTIVSSNFTPYGFYTGIANVPGWTEYNGSGDLNYSNGMTVIYNNQPLDNSGVALEGTSYPIPSIQGEYSILLLGGSIYAENSTNGASIGQTGQIPSDARSIIYWGNALQVSFNGQMLPLTAISTTSNYTVWGVDVSAYAGQTGELLFTAPWPNGLGTLDNIQFSSSSVPEPNVLGFLAMGSLLFGLRRLKQTTS